MDEKGLKQWNATDYLEVYPAAYYRKLEENGNLFVLENPYGPENCGSGCPAFRG